MQELKIITDTKKYLKSNHREKGVHVIEFFEPTMGNKSKWRAMRRMSAADLPSAGYGKQHQRTSPWVLGNGGQHLLTFHRIKKISDY